MVVRRERGRLDDEGIRAADVLLDLDEDLHVGEAPDHRLGQRQVEALRDGLCESRIGVAGDELDGAVLGRHGRFLPRFAGYDVQHQKIPTDSTVTTGEEISGGGPQWQPGMLRFPFENPESGQRLGRDLGGWFSAGYREA